MNFTSMPGKFSIPFANSGTKNTIPTASQIPITPGAASLTDGFPPLTFTPIASGGVPPFGADFNGIFNEITTTTQWQNAGGSFKYDGTFNTAISGYPLGSLLIRNDATGFWFNQSDANTTSPEAGGAGWVPGYNYGWTSITGLTNANVTLTALQFAKTSIFLTGTLTGNINIIFPALTLAWTVVNSTTGAFSVTCKTASGTGVPAPQGLSVSIYGDGTNIKTFNNVSSSVRFAIFDSPGTFTFTPTTSTVYLTGNGAGGGGGGASGAPGGGNGGGGGAFCLKVPVAVTIGTPYTIVIPNGASGGAFSSPGTPGSDGASTTFGGSLFVLGGGFGGIGGGTSVGGGAGGTGTSGSFNGGVGGTQGGISVGGQGGGSLGQGGNPGNAYSGLLGGGGGGGNGSSAGGPFNGGQGGPGSLIVEW